MYFVFCVVTNKYLFCIRDGIKYSSVFFMLYILLRSTTFKPIMCVLLDFFSISLPLFLTPMLELCSDQTVGKTQVTGFIYLLFFRYSVTHFRPQPVKENKYKVYIFTIFYNLKYKNDLIHCGFSDQYFIKQNLRKMQF